MPARRDAAGGRAAGASRPTPEQLRHAAVTDAPRAAPRHGRPAPRPAPPTAPTGAGAAASLPPCAASRLALAAASLTRARPTRTAATLRCAGDAQQPPPPSRYGRDRVAPAPSNPPAPRGRASVARPRAPGPRAVAPPARCAMDRHGRVAAPRSQGGPPRHQAAETDAARTPRRRGERGRRRAAAAEPRARPARLCPPASPPPRPLVPSLQWRRRRVRCAARGRAPAVRLARAPERAARTCQRSPAPSRARRAPRARGPR
jgi:hypothetical protein